MYHTICDCIDTACFGDITFLFNFAMQVQQLKQNSCPMYTGKNCSAQQAANSNDYRTAVLHACASQSIATIGPHNLPHVKNKYTPPVWLLGLGYPQPSLFPTHPPYPLWQDIYDPIWWAAWNQGTGVNADLTNLFSSLPKCSIPTIKNNLRFIFDLTYQNKYQKISNVASWMSISSVFIKTPPASQNNDPLDHLLPFNVWLQAMSPIHFRMNLQTLY